MHLKVETGEAFEETDSEVATSLTREPEQFVGFQLERIVFIHPSVVHAVSGVGLAGFTIKAYDVTHLVADAPRPGMSPKKAVRCVALVLLASGVGRHCGGRLAGEVAPCCWLFGGGFALGALGCLCHGPAVAAGT